MMMVRCLVEGVVGILNDFLSKPEILTTLSPSTIVEGKAKLDLPRKMITFCTHALACTGTPNNIKPRATLAIALMSSNNTG